MLENFEHQILVSAFLHYGSAVVGATNIYIIAGAISCDLIPAYTLKQNKTFKKSLRARYVEECRMDYATSLVLYEGWLLDIIFVNLLPLDETKTIFFPCTCY